jgi:hypothetical protein
MRTPYLILALFAIAVVSTFTLLSVLDWPLIPRSIFAFFVGLFVTTAFAFVFSRFSSGVNKPNFAYGKRKEESRLTLKEEIEKMNELVRGPFANPNPSRRLSVSTKNNSTNNTKLEEEEKEETEDAQERAIKKAQALTQALEEEEERKAQALTQALQEEENKRAKVEEEQINKENEEKAKKQFENEKAKETARVKEVNDKMDNDFKLKEQKRKEEYDNDPSYKVKKDLVDQLKNERDNKKLQALRAKARQLLGKQTNQLAGAMTTESAKKWFSNEKNATAMIQKGFLRKNWGQRLEFQGSSERLREIEGKTEEQQKKEAAQKLYQEIKDKPEEIIEAYRALVQNGFLVEPELTEQEINDLLKRKPFTPGKPPTPEKERTIEKPKWEKVKITPKIVPPVKPRPVAAVVPKTVAKVQVKTVAKAVPKAVVNTKTIPAANINAMLNLKDPTGKRLGWDDLSKKEQDDVMKGLAEDARKKNKTLEEYLGL